MSSIYKAIKSLGFNWFLSVAIAATVIAVSSNYAKCYLSTGSSQTDSIVENENQHPLPSEFVWRAQSVNFDHMYRK